MTQLKTLFLSLILSFTLLNSCTWQTKQDGGKAADVSEKPEDPASTLSKKAWLLVPGVSAGVIHINENISDVYKQLGQPDGGNAAMGKAVAFWTGGTASKKHTTSIFSVRQPLDNPEAKVKEIRLSSPKFRTTEGFGVGDTRREIEKGYQLNRNITLNPALVYDTKEGIAFEFSKETGYCLAVVIYEKGKRLPEAYLSLKETDGEK